MSHPKEKEENKKEKVKSSEYLEMSGLQEKRKLLNMVNQMPASPTVIYFLHFLFKAHQLQVSHLNSLFYSPSFCFYSPCENNQSPLFCASLCLECYPLISPHLTLTLQNTDQRFNLSDHSPIYERDLFASIIVNFFHLISSCIIVSIML